MLKRSTLQERFSDIYEKNIWGSGESGSGEGSELEYAESLRTWLVESLPKYKVRKFVDAPCGDFNWMRSVIGQVDIEYVGYDIVPSVISRNRELYGEENVNFEVANICNDELPICDLLMVRDCLFHLSYEYINKFLVNISNLDYKYLLTTTHILGKDCSNRDIVTGDFRLINLFLGPFNFTSRKVIEVVDDSLKISKIPR